MKKARSVDFSSVGQRRRSCKGPSCHEADFVASHFSRQAARADLMCNNAMLSKVSPSPLSCGCKDTTCVRHCLGRETSIRNEPEFIEERPNYVLQLSDRTFALGRISFLVVALATLADYFYSHFDSNASSAFGGGTRQVSRMSLGSAAISSVTEALSPILPFAGGLDLRREDYWINSGSWVETLQSVATQVQDAFKVPASPEQKSKDSMISQNLSTWQTKKALHADHVLAISSQSPFVSVDQIAELTLRDISELFLLVRSNRGGSGGNSGSSSRINKVVEGIKKAVELSRGKGVKDSEFSGGVDSLKFLAVMRVFAEWRVVRQVPEGYRGFAVGMSLGHKDVVQNVAKIEQAVHNWIDHQSDMIALQSSWDSSQVVPELRTPTIRELLEHEINMDVHPTSRLPRLKEKTAAMGLLWVRRQLHYQTRLFDNVLRVSQDFASTRDAVSAAYQQVYDKYHGWAVQKIFTYSFQAAPEAEEIFRHMNPRLLQQVRDSMRNNPPSAVPNEVIRDGDEKTNPLDDFLGGVVENWEKTWCFITRCDEAKDKVADSKQRKEAGGDQIEELVTREMVKDAHDHISRYLVVVDPLLEDLASLFDELNMDDPTKV